MQFWESGAVLTGLALAALMLAGEGLRAGVPALGRLGIPACILAGTLGFLLGASVFGVLPLDTSVLEAIVYHGLAIVFISVGLQSPEEGRKGGGVLSMSFAVPTMMNTQMFLGLAVVLALGFFTGPMHPGFGIMLPMGFEEGPGQALSLGKAWESSGMQDGAQVGLIIAAAGFAASVLVGVPLVAWGKAQGWVAATDHDQGATNTVEETFPVLPAGSAELLTRQLMVIGVCYLGTYGVVWGLSTLLASMPDIAAMAWGFHFIIGAVVAIFARGVIARLPGPSPLHDGLLGRIGGAVVDLVTCAALAAVQLAVLKANIVVIALIVGLGTAWTLGLTLVLAWRVFPDEPFEHAVVLFGMSTGTLPMGLALLRIVDPELRSSAPVSAVLGSAGSVPLVAPIVLVMVPMAVAGWPDGYPGSGIMVLGLLAAYQAALTAAWWYSGGLRPTPP